MPTFSVLVSSKSKSKAKDTKNQESNSCVLTENITYITIAPIAISKNPTLKLDGMMVWN